MQRDRIRRLVHEGPDERWRGVVGTVCIRRRRFGVGGAGQNVKQRAQEAKKSQCPRKEKRTGHNGFVEDWELADIAVV